MWITDEGEIVLQGAHAKLILNAIEFVANIVEVLASRTDCR